MNLCKVCGREVKLLLELKNSAKTQSVCATSSEALEVPIVPITVYYCSFCDFYQIQDAGIRFYDDQEYYLTTEISETQRNYQIWLLKHIQRYLVSPVAEIGPGDGYFGKLLSDRYDYTGFEPAKKSYDECKNKKLNVINAYFSPHHEKFRTIIMRQVLEHIVQLDVFLKDLMASLHEDGRAIIEVPNIDRARELNRLVDFCPEHLNYFTSSSLSLLFSACGFRIDETIKTYNQEYLLLVASKSRQFKREINPMKLDNTVFWGAGSRGITLCQLLKAAPRYFVDSDRNKWGKFIPSQAIEVKSPDFLFKDKNINSVLITSFFYFDEVYADLLKNDFKGTIYRVNERNEVEECKKPST